MRYILLVVVVLVVLVDQGNGLSCIPCAHTKCEAPRGCRRENYVKDLCHCCDVCPTKFGQPCSELKPKCAKNLWCIKMDGDSAEAKKNLPAVCDGFEGVCGRIKIERKEGPKS